MTIYAKKNGVQVQITEVIVKKNGVLVRQSPLQGKRSGIIVNYINYGYAITALINMTPDIFNAATLTTTIAMLAGTVDNIVVSFSDGDFWASVPINITTSNVSFIGTGKTALNNNGNHGLGIITVTGQSGAELTNINISKIIFNGFYPSANITCSGIQCSYVGKSNINIGTVYNASKTLSSAINKKGLTVSDCVMKNCSGFGLYFKNNNSNCSILRNMIFNNNSQGILLITSDTFNITGNVINNNASIGIQLTSSSFNKIFNNAMQNNNSYGMKLTSSQNNIINGNTIQNNSDTGMYMITGSNFNCIGGNSIQNNNYFGVELATSDSNIFSSNVVQHNSQHGFVITSASKNNVLIGNGSTGNSGQAIAIGGADTVSTLVIANRFAANGTNPNTNTSTSAKIVLNTTF
jgi:parallel beta-helix repeat protein